ncbi:hypothetical protein PT276_08165 [Orbaceae bacterium ESL0721]|nr:hypothetical protein [Orbaceae bacterium ESL0721]
MKQCYQSVINAATGRNLTKSEVQDIFENISKNQQRLARQDPEWQTYSAEEKLNKAAELGVNDAIHQAELKQRRVALTIAARSRLDNAIKNMVDTGIAKNELEALNRIVAYNPDNKTGFQALDTKANSTRNWAIGQMLTAFDHSKVLGLFEDEKGVKDLVREMYGEHTGNEKAKLGAQQWLEQTELLRKAFNRAGGDIGKLDNWALPQEHSQVKISRAGEEQWINDLLPKLDREKYVKPDGTLMSDAEVKTFLTEAYETVSTGGVNKIKSVGRKVSSMVANRRNESRQIFFKNADSFLDYHAKYGDRGIFDIMMGHIDGVSRDLANIEIFGPNPNLMFHSLLESAKGTAIKQDRVNATKTDKLAEKTSDLYDFVAGNYKPAVSSRFATGMDSLRSLMTASKLGSAAITALTDQGTMMLMARTNGLPMGGTYKAMMASLNPLNRGDRHRAQRNGLALESTLASLNRWGIDNMNTNWTSKAATSVLRLSGLMKISDAAKEGYATSMMSSIGHLVATNTDFATLTKTSKFDAELIKRHGADKTDFAVWKQAELDEWSGVKNILTPESIMRIPNEKIAHLGNPERIKFEAARKLIGMLSEEADMAVVTPGTRDRVRLGASLPRGTIGGEIVRSITQFKAFPIAMVARMWARGSSLPTGLQKSYFGGALLLGTTLFGAAALQINNVVSGRKPQDMSEPQFWIEAMLKGGALGVFGDFIFSDKNSFNSTLGEMAMGPLGSGIGQFADLTIGNTRRALQGEDTRFGGDAIRFIKGMTLGANLWYTKAVTDHLLFNQLQEAVSPGYLERYTNRQQTVRGTEYWWRPDEVIPGG